MSEALLAFDTFSVVSIWAVLLVYFWAGSRRR